MKSFGFGDPLGLGLPGHIAAARRFSFAPVFAQHSGRESLRSLQAAKAALNAVQLAVAAAGFRRPWGADADGLRTEADVARAAAAGFTTFTIDPSAFIEHRADQLGRRELEEALAVLGKEGVLPPHWQKDFLGQRFELPGCAPLQFDAASVGRIAIKFGRALQHARRLAHAVASRASAEGGEIELSLHESPDAITPLEHWFIACELQRRAIPVVSVALRFGPQFAGGIDYPGDADAFETTLRSHAAIAARHGPYKLSFHDGSDKFSLYPAMGRICGELLHVKTCGTTYLEALRVVCRGAPDLFREIAALARARFAGNAATRPAAERAAMDKLFAAGRASSLERSFLDAVPGRRLLHATRSLVLAEGETAKGRPFREAITEILQNRPADYHELLDAHFTRHLTLLNAG